MKQYRVRDKRTQAKAILSGALIVALAGCQTLTAGSGLISANIASDGSCVAPEMKQTAVITSPSGTVRTADEIKTFLAERMTAMQVPGASIAIISEGETVFHYATGLANVETEEPITDCTIFQGASITKPLFGYFVMTFVEEGKLDLDRPLFEYLPYAAIANDERYKKITARMALTHRTGFPNWRTDYPDDKLFIQFEPGTSYHYSGEGYKYLTLVLQQIAGVDAAGLEVMFQERVARPFGQINTQIVPDKRLLARTASPHRGGQLISVTSDNSYSDFGAAYGVHSEAFDFSKWLIGLMNGGRLSAATLEEYFRLQNVPIPEDEPLRQFGLQDYALGFSIHEFPFGRRYIHGGNNPGYTSLITLDRESKWGVVLFTNADQATDFAVELLLFLNMPSE